MENSAQNDHHTGEDSSHTCEEVMMGAQILHRSGLECAAPMLHCFLLFGLRHSGKLSVVKAQLAEIAARSGCNDDVNEVLDRLMRVVDGVHWPHDDGESSSSSSCSSRGTGDDVTIEERVSRLFDWAIRKDDSKAPFRAVVFRNIDLLLHDHGPSPAIDGGGVAITHCIRRHLQRIAQATASADRVRPVYVFFTTCKPHSFPQELLDFCNIPVFVPLPSRYERLVFIRDQMKTVMERLAAVVGGDTVNNPTAASAIIIRLKCANGDSGMQLVEMHGRSGAIDLPENFSLYQNLAGISRGASYLRMTTFINSLLSKLCWRLQCSGEDNVQDDARSRFFTIAEGDIIQLAEAFFSTVKCTPPNNDVMEYARKFYDSQTLAEVEEVNIGVSNCQSSYPQLSTLQQQQQQQQQQYTFHPFGESIPQQQHQLPPQHIPQQSTAWSMMQGIPTPNAQMTQSGQMSPHLVQQPHQTHGTIINASPGQTSRKDLSVYRTPTQSANRQGGEMSQRLMALKSAEQANMLISPSIQNAKRQKLNDGTNRTVH